MSDRNRRPPGQPTGGQFAPQTRPEAAASLAPLADIADELEAASSVDGERLWAYVTHENPEVRAETTFNLNITAEQLERLADDDDEMVRWSVAQLPYPGLANRLAGDASPVVRTIVLADGFDLDDDRRAALEADPIVADITSRLVSSPAM